MGIFFLFLFLQAATIFQTKASPTPPRQFDLTEGEIGRFSFTFDSNIRQHFYCHLGTLEDYVTRRREVVQKCLNKNLKYSLVKPGSKEKLFPFFSPQFGEKPTCPPLPHFENGFWQCQGSPRSTRNVGPYTSCEPKCYRGKLDSEFYVRCNESLKWDHWQTPKCILNNIPRPPENIQISQIGAFSAFVKWNQTDFKKYRIKLLKLGDTEPYFYMTRDNKYTINELSPNSSYEIWINTVYNEDQLSSPSKSSQFSTLPLESLAPAVLNATALSPNSIMVSYMLPPITPGVLEYRLFVSDLVNLVNKTVTKYQTSFTVYNLTSGINHEIKMAAILVHGMEVFSSSVDIYTPQFIPKAPRNVSILLLNETCMELKWSLPDDDSAGGIIRGMKVYMKEIEGGEFEHQISGSLICSRVFCNLKPGTLYCFELMQYTFSTEGNNVSVCKKTKRLRGPEGKSTYDSWWVVTGIAVLIALVVVCIICCCIWKGKRRNSSTSQGTQGCFSELSLSGSETLSNDSPITGETPESEATPSTITNGSETNPLLKAVHNKNDQPESKKGEKSIKADQFTDLCSKRCASNNDENLMPESDNHGKHGNFEMQNVLPIKTLSNNNNKTDDQLLVDLSNGQQTEENGESKEKDGGTPLHTTNSDFKISVDLTSTRLDGGSNAATATALSCGGDYVQTAGSGTWKDSVKTGGNDTWKDSENKDVGKNSIALEDVKTLNVHSFDYSPDGLSATDIALSSAPLLTPSNSASNIGSCEHEDDGKQNGGPIFPSGDDHCSTVKEAPVSCTEFLPSIILNMAEPEPDSETGLESHLENTCNMTINDFLDKDQCSSDFFAQLAHKLDPDTYADMRTWKGFAKDILNYSTDRINFIFHHTKGNLNMGHFESLIPTMKFHGIRLGDLVEYYSRKASMRRDVVDLILKCHSDCLFCNRFR